MHQKYVTLGFMKNKKKTSECIGLYSLMFNLSNGECNFKKIISSLETEVKNKIILEFGLKETSEDNPYVVIVKAKALENRFLLLTYWDNCSQKEHFSKVKEIFDEILGSYENDN
jgi:hypothetical protein